MTPRPFWKLIAACKGSGEKLAVAQSPLITKGGFYQAIESSDHALPVQPDKQALWANALLPLACRTG